MYSTWKRINFYLRHQELKIENSSNTIMTALDTESLLLEIIHTLMSWEMHNLKLILNKSFDIKILMVCCVYHTLFHL